MIVARSELIESFANSKRTILAGVTQANIVKHNQDCALPKLVYA